MIKKIKRGEIYLANMGTTSGSEQSGVRPVLIIQNNKGNKYSPTTIVACLSSKIETKVKKNLILMYKSSFCALEKSRK